ncbi:MAG: hypothetical protein MSG64_16475 [Pyrinomonadaceae bacterium MAG19_C2-C3]|nr:hypothetical protein [Pyrinomonadaceae bacterium MAG19_C2-C3]
MNLSIYIRTLHRIAALIVMCALILPTVAVALDKKGEKEYKRGLAFESAQRWEDAAQAFTLALAARPSDVEYQLHYRRAVFNASQSFVMQGRSLAERGDYIGAYNAFRQSFGYDQTNQLAQAEMERMIRLQQAKEEANGTNGTTPARSSITRSLNGNPAIVNDPGKPPATSGEAARLTPTAYNPGQVVGQNSVQNITPPRAESRRNVQFAADTNLEQVVRELARQLELNVIFDGQFQARTRQLPRIDLQNVTVAQALDYIFLTQGLFFQRLGRRTILVAEQSKRGQYQQLAIRTFYLKNIAPNDARTVIAPLVPPVGGLVPTFSPNNPTNSFTVRATPEQLNVIGNIIKTIDKDRSEVVMDVSIYEVSRNDLLQLGGQLGSAGTLGNLGGTSSLLVPFTGSNVPNAIIGTGTAALASPTALGAGILIPSLQLSALQTKNNSRLLAQTQVHAFDGEQSEARIGNRVPIQTAQIYSGFQNPGTPGTGNTAGGAFNGGGFPVIQYEPTGLTLKFKPTVFPNLDVQVTMSIESKDVTGVGSLTPTFTERTISGTARIQNNRTMMLASIAQDRESRGRSGIPLLGLIPILGRFVTTPTRDNSKTDIVIAVTPRVLRAPSINPSDERELPSGSQQSPASETLEAFLRESDREEQLARNAATPNAIPNLTPDTNAVITQNTMPPSPSPVVEAARSLVTPAPRVVIDNQVANQTVNQVAANQTASVNQAASNNAHISIESVPVSSFVIGNNDAVRRQIRTAPTVESDVPSFNAPVFVPAPRALIDTSPVVPDETPRASASINERVNEIGNGRMNFVSTVAANTPARTIKAASAVQPVATSAADLRFIPNEQWMRVGERRRLMVMLKTDAPLNTAVANLRFDPRVLAVRSVAAGNLFTASEVQPILSHSMDARGNLLVSISAAGDAAWTMRAGVLLILEVEAMGTGDTTVAFESDNLHLVAPDNRVIAKRTAPGRVVVN